MRQIYVALAGIGFACATAHAQPAERPPIEASTPAPVPKQADGLDTLKLASAHREKSRSTEERTNGLWQSWLLSVCEGCASLPPAAQHVQAVERRDAELSLRRAPPRPNGGGGPTKLSNEDLDRIRVMPRRDASNPTP